MNLMMLLLVGNDRYVMRCLFVLLFFGMIFLGDIVRLENEIFYKVF